MQYQDQTELLINFAENNNTQKNYLCNTYKHTLKIKESDEIIMLRVKKSKAKAFRNMLKKFDFVEMETPEDRLDRYIRSAPKNVPVTDDDIMNMMER